MQGLIMTPGTGERALRFVGDRLRFALSMAGGGGWPDGWRAALRTSLGRASVLRQEIIKTRSGGLRSPDAFWHDLPMQREANGWSIELPLTQPGYFRSKAYAVDGEGRQHWPEGPDFGVSVHPDAYRAGNTIYCAFVRMFGASRPAPPNDPLEHLFATLDRDGYTVIPPSGKFRDLIKQLPHIIDTLGCRILQLLPVNPTPTTYARMGRFGSPYAAQDLLAVDPALVEFDRRTTGIDQFRELTYATHLQGGRIFLDIVINHTGWAAREQETHPEWYLRDEAGNFVSPGAWGVTWEDLSEFDHRNPELWDYLAEVFLTWCRRGVDGFRCDAGYKVPMPAWQYITARVLEEFPDTIFLLEGLGGPWSATENLLTEGGMQWAYSELFQNYAGAEVANYLDYCLRQSQRTGLYVHYSETHDNERLAKQGRAWSLLRNRLCALTSVSGGFGFACGVEWLASEKIQVHQRRDLAWGSERNLIGELGRLNRLLAGHPCFYDGAKLTRLSSKDSAVYALRRDSAEGRDHLLVLINTDVGKPGRIALDPESLEAAAALDAELLGQPAPEKRQASDGQVEFVLPPGACFCLADAAQPRGLAGRDYQRARAQAAWALTALNEVLPIEEIGPYQWRELAEHASRSPRNLLATVPWLDPGAARKDPVSALQRTVIQFPQVVEWSLADCKRVTLVPPRHWLLLEDRSPFRATLKLEEKPLHIESIEAGDGHAACFPPVAAAAGGLEVDLILERYAAEDQEVVARIRFLSSDPTAPPNAPRDPRSVALLTNGLGGMARIHLDLGTVQSKYDCVLAANLHPRVPVDRHVLVKRMRVWVNADGFITPLRAENLEAFTAGPPAEWSFEAGAGDGRTVRLGLTVDMIPERNATVLRFTRPAHGDTLPDSCDVRLTVRFDIEDRNFHHETHRNPGADSHFMTHARPLEGRIGFAFTPAPDRQLRVVSDAGFYHHEAEWSENIPHPIEQSRGQVARGDAYSPGWFELPLRKGSSVTLLASVETEGPAVDQVKGFVEERLARNRQAVQRAQLPEEDAFGRQLALAVQAFVARREEGKTVIAGYPWFLDWGRDSLICARGLLAAGMADEVRQLLMIFGRFADRGTLPNIIHGEDASDRDTSDAPLWYGIACEELAGLGAAEGPGQTAFYDAIVDRRGRTVADVLREIGEGYRAGTPNGIRMDGGSGLIWSPSHFTWMDTNHPAGTPREGYPVEIQVLWIRLLRQLARLGAKSSGESWELLAQRAAASLDKLFWLEERGFMADLLIAKPNQPAEQATVDTALRSNYLFAISLGLLTGERAQRAVGAAIRHLVVPGALRSLAPLRVSPPLPIYDSAGQLLNDPEEPYLGRYEGDEDSRRKPAYHNGTAWTWTFPSFCEALARAWEFNPAAVAAARAYLRSLDRLLAEGCLGQLPEILDGDAPHAQRGCDAQAWAATEALRVWKLLRARS